nr:hypothetical protein [Tanacetum cinerariifolium]
MELCTKLQSRVLALETSKANQAMEIGSLKRKVKKLEKKASNKTHKLKRLYKIGSSTRVESSKDAGLCDQEDASKHESTAATTTGVKDSTAATTTGVERCLEIIPEDDDDVTIEATPISSKYPTIVDYKIYKEGRKSYFKIIRADGNSQNYLTFRKMFKNFNIEDLEVLWSIVKARFKKTKPVDDMDNLLCQTLKTMFEHPVEDNIWKYQQEYGVLSLGLKDVSIYKKYSTSNVE